MIVLVRVLFVAVFSWAQEPPPTPVANKIENDINVVREQLSQQDLKQKKVLSALYGINNNLQRLVGNKGRLTEQRNMIDLEIEGLNKKIEENKAQADLQKSQLKERLRAIYMLGGPTLARFLFASTIYAEVDDQGRFVIPKNLLQFADLSGIVVIIGVGDHFEIWNRGKWERYMIEIKN
jgi:septal ring factor EnvC (AmiA/AmiB activator)